MPAISKIRFTNVIYENGDKRYNDELFLFDGHNGAIVLENGGGKTVFIQTALQAIIPHVKVANRKMKDTLRLDEGPAHIAIEWILNERPRRYGLTCVTLFMTKDSLDSLKYIYEYSSGDDHSIENLPFVRGKRPADRGEMQDYYSQMANRQINAHTFDTKERYSAYLEENFHIVTNEWQDIVKINSGEGDVERFFDDCQTTGQLVDRLLIPNIEDAMAGFESRKFANSFESRLASFQEYKHFQDKLGEYRKIQSRLDELTHYFERLEQKRQAYIHSKMTARAYTENAEQQQNTYSTKLQAADSALVALDEEKKSLHHREKSLAVAFEQEQLAGLEEDLRLLGEETRQAGAKWVAVKELLAQLQLAEQLGREDVLSSRAERLQQELAELERHEESDDSLEQFKDIGQQLAGAFVDRQAELEKELDKQRLTLRQYKDLVADDKKALTELDKKIETARLNERGESASILHLQGDMDSIVKELLLEQAHLSMEDQQQLWVTEQTELDQQITDLKNRTLELEKLVEQIGQEQEKQRGPLAEISTSLTKKNKDIDQIEKEERVLIGRLQAFSMIWMNLQSVHDRQESIEQSLREELARHHLQLELLLADERSATRLHDDYKEQQSFFADAFLNDQLGQWKGQFPYLETGIEFVTGLDALVVEREDYPFWAMTLVTKEKEAPLLMKKIEDCQGELQFPIQVLTLDEATAIVRGEQSFSTEWMTPAHWSASLNGEAFREWQAEIQQKAQSASVTRQNFSELLSRWKSLQEAFQQFIHDYPLAYKQELQREMKELHQQEFRLQQWMEKNRLLLVEYKKEMGNNKKLIESLESKSQGLAHSLYKAKDYLDKKRKKQGHEKTILFYREEVSERLQQSKKIDRNLKERQQDVTETEDIIRETTSFLEKEVLDHPLFAKVRGESALPTQQSIEVLKENYLALELKVAGLLNSRQGVERERLAAKEQLAQVKLVMKGIMLEYPHLQRDVPSFPSNGHDQMQQLIVQIPKLSVSTKNAESLEKKQQSAVDKKRGRVEARLSEVENPLTFQQPLSVEQQELEASWLIWRQSSDSAKHEQQLAQQQLERWRDVVRMLEREAVSHQFLLEEIVAATMSDKDVTDFTYNSEKRVVDIGKNLKQIGQLHSEELERVDKERQSYIGFCRTTITDSRLQETAVQGIESKSSYEDVLTYKQLLEKRLQMAEQYAEQHIHTHDKELELFLRHMSTHVSALRTELLSIPKTTTVKIDDGPRQIFHIAIPEWQEDEGKQLLRSHINWILARLDSQEYRSDEGEWDYGKVKNSLEKWLNSRQLLQIVLQNKPIRISCHKVTNDNKISRAAYSWEESNSWSGGEKWSKNMSLFLGLLNYVAEKKQHIQPHMKRHRSVILDNPFGKASSGHVLTPVFFIAEQLGFQIITLTAHAEGKFLRDFFPVVYSCRLRQAVGSDKQVMTTNKNIQSAFLRDLDPNSIERINQVEQMDLFE